MKNTTTIIGLEINFSQRQATAASRIVGDGSDNEPQEHAYQR